MRVLDLVFVVILVALVSFGLSMQSRPDAPQPAVSPSTGPARARPPHPPVASFELADLNGNPYRYAPETAGDLFVILSAKDCQECQQRVSTRDVDALKWIKSSQKDVPVYNFIVFADVPQARQFADRYHPQEDRVFADPGGAVSVARLSGSDSTCWMYIRDGNFLYRGPADLDQLRRAVTP